MIKKSLKRRLNIANGLVLVRRSLNIGDKGPHLLLLHPLNQVERDLNIKSPVMFKKGRRRLGGKGVRGALS